MTEKHCDTCKFRRKDLECGINHCAHPDYMKLDTIEGPMMTPIMTAAEQCQLVKWEPRGFLLSLWCKLFHQPFKPGWGTYEPKTGIGRWQCQKCGCRYTTKN